MERCKVSAALSSTPSSPPSTSTSSPSSSSSSIPSSATKTAVSTFLGGAASGIVTSIICSPLDVAKVRIQVQGNLAKYNGWNAFSAVKTIFKEEGFGGLYVGIFPTLLTVPLFWSIYWSTYTSFKTTFQEQLPNSPPFVHHILSAISAGAIGDIVTNPLWVTRTRMQTLILQGPGHPTANITTLGMIQNIYRNEGVGAFYRGLGASFLGLSHVAVQFPIYEHLKKAARDRRNGEEEAMMDIVGASLVAKLVASVLTYPHEVLRSRMQDARVREGMGLISLVKLIIREEGALSLYSGLAVNCIRVFPATISTFLCFEYFSKTFESLLS